ncbi:MAG: phosphoribosylformylglycinamidine synthase, partial [Deltaproteobacteria bacterium]|nr:phosphoribosylformylglycinamidine synthase [Deltaproteobacteria bacterium]
MKKTTTGLTRTLRVEKSPADEKWDSRGHRALRELGIFFPAWSEHQNLRAFATELFWVHSAEATKAAMSELEKILADEILGDPLFNVSVDESGYPGEARKGYRWWCLEKGLRAGVTDNAGHVLSEAIELVSGRVVECRSGTRLWLELPKTVPAKEVDAYANEVFFNSLIERVEVWSEEDARACDSQLYREAVWVEVSAGVAENGAVETFDLGTLAIKDLEKLSDQRLWALSRSELLCVQEHYATLKRPMTDVEIEVIAQTWSEHCKHKIFAANIEVTNDREDLLLPARIESVFKTYIRGATREIPASYLKSVFEDNAGVIKISSELDCAIKVETHNSPSALDPYGGALTGIVGVNRDILGVGLGAQPIANLDVFCVGSLDTPEPLPPRLHHPRRILEGVRLGVEHGGNKSGIPTVTGAVVHHPGYLGKPLVFVGTIGIIPTDKPFIEKQILPGDKIVMAGGRIGKDGIHGATFSSLEMNEDSPVSAVQLGDPLTQRRVWDFLIEARDQALFRAVTDNGAGGLSSSIGELARLCGKKGGARMDVGQARTKYPGLLPYELVVSESQERMSFAVAPEKLETFLALAKA